MATAAAIIRLDGSIDFSGGVNSLRVPTVQSDNNPNGLPRNCLSWLNNATVRGGGIMPRCGWKWLGMAADGKSAYQGGFLYEPDGENPYHILAIGGHVWKVLPDWTAAPVDLSAQFGLTMPTDQTHFYFCQAEKFLIIQAGDYVTLPLFWDGTTLRRSKGITNGAVDPGTPGVNEIPAAGPMDYYMGRVWYAQGRNYSAGDIVGGNSGTVGNAFRDAVLNVTENPLVLGGDGFAVPTQAGNIRALFHNANINSTLGQGQLLIGTRKAIYAQDVPVTRSDWIAADASNQPKQTVVQLVNGPVNDRSVVRMNGDVFYQTLEPAVASLATCIRDFSQWGNRGISGNMMRVLSYNDRALLWAGSGIVFDNRIIETALPKTLSQGVVHQALMALDFIPINEFNATLSPCWEGIHSGLQVLQLFAGDFGGLERAFALVVSAQETTFGQIELWEITNSDRSDTNTNGESRVTWNVELPAFNWGNQTQLKRMVGAELWIDKIYGEVFIRVEYRPDQHPCWIYWKEFKVCTARTSAEDVDNPVVYPETTYRESYEANAQLPLPQNVCNAVSGSPSNVAYQQQIRITVKGWARIRGIYLQAEMLDKALYGTEMVC